MKKSVWKVPRNEELLEKIKREDIPKLLDFIENQIIHNPEEFLFSKEDPSIADISLGTIFRNAECVKYSIDGKKWPKSARFIRKVLDHPGFMKLRGFEEICLKTKIEMQREALKSKGVDTIDLGMTGEKAINGLFEKTHVKK